MKCFSRYLPYLFRPPNTILSSSCHTEGTRAERRRAGWVGREVRRRAEGRGKRRKWEESLRSPLAAGVGPGLAELGGGVCVCGGSAIRFRESRCGLVENPPAVPHQGEWCRILLPFQESLLVLDAFRRSRTKVVLKFHGLLGFAPRRNGRIRFALPWKQFPFDAWKACFYRVGCFASLPPTSLAISLCVFF